MTWGKKNTKRKLRPRSYIHPFRLCINNCCKQRLMQFINTQTCTGRRWKEEIVLEEIVRSVEKM